MFGPSGTLRWYNYEAPGQEVGGLTLPSYEEAVGPDGEEGVDDSRPPPPYESLFGHGIEFSGVFSRDPSPDRSQDVEEVRVSGLGDRTVLDALDREFKWTSVSVGVSVAILVVLILVIIIVIFPRDAER